MMYIRQYLVKIAWVFIGFIPVLFSNSATAWEHEVSLGYGGGKEAGENYNNIDYVLTAKLYKFNKIDDTLILTIDGSISNLRTNTDNHNSLYAAAIAPSFRAYFLNPKDFAVKPYLGVSSGPVYLSEQQLGNNEQGSHFAIQSTLETGLEFGKNHGFDLNVHFAHYCNAGLAKPNQGFNFPFIVSLGYQW